MLIINAGISTDDVILTTYQVTLLLVRVIWGIS